MFLGALSVNMGFSAVMESLTNLSAFDWMSGQS